MAFNRVAAVLAWVLIAPLQGGFVAGTPVKRSGEASCQGTQCTIDETHPTQMQAGVVVTESPEQLADVCVVDPGLERRTLILEDAANTWAATLPPILDSLTEISDSLKKPPMPQEPTGMDCSILFQRGYNTSGIYKIAHHSNALHDHFYAYCDMETEDGGWTVFQRRRDGSTDFYRTWSQYKQGFGHLDSEHWLGLDQIYLLTSLANYELRIDLEHFDGSIAYAKYDNFRIFDEWNSFKLVLGSYSGTAGDSLASHNGRYFSTKDEDHDTEAGSSCAERWTGAWWYYNCHRSNLNGQYLGDTPDNKGIVWQTWRSSQGLKVSEMKIRRKV